MERRDASKKKSDFEVLTINLIDRRFGVSYSFFNQLVIQILNCHSEEIFIPTPDFLKRFNSLSKLNRLIA